MQRLVQPEILDSLPSCNIDAIASRRDLVKINRLMGNYRWIQTSLQSTSTNESRLLEIGAGDGTLASRLIKHFPPDAYHAIDLSSQPENWPSRARWISGDLLSFDRYGEYTDLVANLILHHFKPAELGRLGAKICESRIERIVASEPCRRPFHKWQLRAGKLIGFNYVTLNDGCISVDAGFRGNELPQLLGLSESEWNWQIKESWMGAYRMQAKRK